MVSSAGGKAGFVFPNRQDVYRALRREGHSKAASAAIANAGHTKAGRMAMAHKSHKAVTLRGRR